MARTIQARLPRRHYRRKPPPASSSPTHRYPNSGGLPGRLARTACHDGLPRRLARGEVFSGRSTGGGGQVRTELNSSLQTLNSMADDYYKILEVPRTASAEEIQKAYRRMARKYHPDLHEDEKEKETAKQKFQQVQAAYDVLSEPEKREMYDRYGENFQQMPPGGSPFGGATGPGGMEIDISQLFGGGGGGGAFEQIFRQFGGAGAGVALNRSPSQRIWTWRKR